MKHFQLFKYLWSAISFTMGVVHSNPFQVQILLISWLHFLFSCVFEKRPEDFEISQCYLGDLVPLLPTHAAGWLLETRCQASGVCLLNKQVHTKGHNACCLKLCNSNKCTQTFEFQSSDLGLITLNVGEDGILKMHAVLQFQVVFNFFSIPWLQNISQEKRGAVTSNSMSLSQILQRSLVSSLFSIIPIISPWRFVILQNNTRNHRICSVNSKEKKRIWAGLVSIRFWFNLAKSLFCQPFSYFVSICPTISYYLFKKISWNEIIGSKSAYFTLWYMSNFPPERWCKVIPQPVLHEDIYSLTFCLPLNIPNSIPPSMN